MDIEGQGSDVSLENIQGQVTINGAYTGTLDFKNLAQPLQFEGMRNTELHVEAVPGHISMDMGQFNGAGLVGPVRLITRSRDIKIADFSKSLALETERGDIELQPSLPVPPIEARSGIGEYRPGAARQGRVPTGCHGRARRHGERFRATYREGSRRAHGAPEGQGGRRAAGAADRYPRLGGCAQGRHAGERLAGTRRPPQAPKPPKPPSLPKDLKDSEIKL